MAQNELITGSPPLKDSEFKLFRDLIYKKSGINLNESKKALLQTRLRKLIIQQGFNSYKEHYQFVVKDKTGVELMRILDAISTNVTSFFREIHHFEHLDKVVIPEFLERNRSKPNPVIRGWSAACSSGEEPYSILFTLLKNKAFQSSKNIKLLATDISTQMLNTASQGIYPGERVKPVHKNMLRKHFIKEGKGESAHYMVRDEFREMVFFKRFNLMTPAFPFNNKFDFIFCRNVMIYFDVPTRQKLISNFYDFLKDGGYLFIGHSESLSLTKHQFKYVRPTVYKK